MGFQQLFWGILFFFDFRIQGIDVLPDIIGYILIFVGLQKLETLNGHFVTAKKFAFPLIFISIIDIIQLNTINLWIGLIGIVLIVLNLVMVFHICTGISEMATGQGKTQLAEVAMNRWKLYLIVQIIALVLVPLALIFGPVTALLVIPLFLFSVVVLILLMMLMKKCQQELMTEG